MTTHALFDSKYGTGDIALYSQVWEEPIAVLHAVENGNIDQSLVVITDALSGTPTVYVDRHSGAGSLWRHFMFGVSGAEGKRPLYKINRATKDGAFYIGIGYKPVSTQDFDTWTQADTMSLVGGTSGTIEWQFAAAHESGATYLSNCPVNRYSEAVDYAAHLLSTYPTIVSPTSSADSSGVYAVTPAETNHLGNAVGGNNQFAFKLTFSDTPNDGHRKRKLVLTEGIHAAGEAQQWHIFKGMIDWIISSSDAEAVALRENWDVYLYFVANPNGLRGGNYRTTFRSALDPNRVWDYSSVITETNNLRAAILADTDGWADAAMHTHGDVYTTADFQGWVHPDDNVSGTRLPAMQTMMTQGATIFGSAFDSSTSGTYNNDVWWTRDVLGCKVSFDAEIGAMPTDTRVSYFEGIGQKWLKTLQATDALSAFITAELQPPLFTNTNTFFAHTLTQGSQTLEPSLFVNDNTFYSATLNLGAVTIEPGLLTNTNQFYSHTVSQDGATQTLQPGLFANDNTFFAAAIAPGAITIEPGLYSNTNTFYAHTLSVGAQTLEPSLFSNTNQFYSATVQVGALTITPELFTNENTFYAHSISQDGSLQTLSPELFTNSNQFYSLTVSVGSITLTPELFANTNTFYTHSVGGQNRVRWSSSITINQSSLYVATDIDVPITIDSSASFTVDDVAEMEITLTKRDDATETVTYTYTAGDITISGSDITLLIDRTDFTQDGYYNIKIRMTDQFGEVRGITPCPSVLRFYS